MTSPKDNKVTEKASDIAKSIWLAGLGAYGKAFDEAHEHYEKVSKDTARVFEELVAKGKKIDAATTGKLSSVRETTASSLEERIAKVRQSLGFGQVSTEELAKRIDDLDAKLDLIIQSLGAKSTVAGKDTDV